MQRQSKWMSATEVGANQVLGFTASVLLLIYFGPYIGITGVVIVNSSIITVILTVFSICRSFGLRRLFDWFDYRRNTYGYIFIDSPWMGFRYGYRSFYRVVCRTPANKG